MSQGIALSGGRSAYRGENSRADNRTDADKGNVEGTKRAPERELWSTDRRQDVVKVFCAKDPAKQVVPPEV
jgi:hypothetical protein